MVELSDNEQDALAANCPDCWSRPGVQCKVMVRGKVINRMRRHPHPNRIDRAERRGILNGAGRILLQRKAYKPPTGWVT